jgi:hypothetical protein
MEKVRKPMYEQRMNHSRKNKGKEVVKILGRVKDEVDV